MAVITIFFFISVSVIFDMIGTAITCTSEDFYLKRLDKEKGASVALGMKKNSEKVCSFCNRQLNALDATQAPTEAQLRWLDAVIGKDVPERDEEVLNAVKEIRNRFSKEEAEQASFTTPQKTMIVQQGTNVKKVKADYDSDAIIKELQNRVSALENELRSMKRKQMIKTIIELGAPFVLLILLFIVVLSSGVIDNFKAIFDMAGISL